MDRAGWMTHLAFLEAAAEGSSSRSSALWNLHALLDFLVAVLSSRQHGCCATWLCAGAVSEWWSLPAWRVRHQVVASTRESPKMRVRSRFLAAVCAVILSVTALTPTAVAEEPPWEWPMVSCPTAPELSAIVGLDLSLFSFGRSSCFYVEPNDGQVTFDFYGASTEEFVSLRKSVEDKGFTVVDVPELGSRGFKWVDDDVVNLRWSDGESVARIYYLSVPLAQADVVVSVANLFAAAISNAPPTVPAKAFTLTCPTAKQVSRALGRTVALVPRDENPCAFEYGDSAIVFLIAPGYGSIVEFRARQILDYQVGGAPIMGQFRDFAGLTPGAFTFSDLTPPILSWQLEEGVVAQLVASEQDDVVRRLALMFADVQHEGGSPTTPGGTEKPGLPSTGD